MNESINKIKNNINIIEEMMDGCESIAKIVNTVLNIL